MKVCIWPSAAEIQSNHGIGRIVHAQHKYLPQLGVELTGPERAEVIACHTQQSFMPDVHVLHLHGLYWTAEPNTGRYNSSHNRANQLIAEAARRARVITVPSEWTAMPFKRDMRISPRVIGHGIDLAEWQAAPNKGVRGEGYVLWNKNRDTDVCDPTPAYKLAEKGVNVVSTFIPPNSRSLANLKVIGPQSHEVIKGILYDANVYLATVKETFGIGTIEAMACGVPVLGFNHGGTASIVTHKENGYLVKPGDYDALHEGYQYIIDNWARLSQAAHHTAEGYDWPKIMEQYAELYREVNHPDNTDVSIVITSYNYADYLETSINAALSQSLRCEIVVVDDGSTDATPQIAAKYQDKIRYIRQGNSGVASARNNGIATATGAYIICLDADDALHPQYAETLQKAMASDRGLGIAYTGISLLKDELQYINGWPPEFSWDAQIAGGAPPSNCIPSACMFRKSMWERSGGYRQQYKPAEDAEFWTRGLSLGFTAKRVVNDGLFYYRPHAGSASRSNPWHPIDAYLPFVRTKQSPLAAPADKPVPVYSYSEPTVSVIIPVTEKHAQILELAIESVAGQSFRNWELIVVDDSNGKVHSQYYGKLPFVNWSITNRCGPGAARNIGIYMAKAPLCLFLDADDYLHPDALLKMVGAYSKSDGRYIYTDWDFGDGVCKTSAEFEQESFLTGPRHPITALVPTNACKEVLFDETMKVLEDWDFFARLVISGYHGYRLAEPLVYVSQTYSTRTPLALKDRAKWDTILNTKYVEANVMSCCGSDGGATLRAKMDLGMIPSVQEPVSESVIRLEYTGTQKGSVTYGGPGITPTGQRYPAGDNSMNKYINAQPEDVNWLVNLGIFRIINLEKPSLQDNKLPVIEPVAEVIPPIVFNLETDKYEMVLSDTKEPTTERIVEAELKLESIASKPTKKGKK